MIKQILAGVRRIGPYRSVVLAVLALAVSIPFWRAVVVEAEQSVTREIEIEDNELCARFGFAAGSAEHWACHQDLLGLRRAHERRMDLSSLP